MDDGLKVSKLAIASLVFGIIAMLVFSINLLLPLAPLAFLTSLVIAPFAILAMITGASAAMRNRKSEGSQQDHRIAVAGIILGVTAPLVVIAWFFLMLELGFSF